MQISVKSGKSRNLHFSTEFGRYASRITRRNAKFAKLTSWTRCISLGVFKRYKEYKPLKSIRYFRDYEKELYIYGHLATFQAVYCG